MPITTETPLKTSAEVNKYLTSDDLARRLGVSRRSIQRLRYTGTGPEWVELWPGQIRYAIEDVISWELTRPRHVGPVH